MINDIFSKSKSTKELNLKIIIDNREKKSLVPAELYAQNFEISYKQLLVGDYIINDTIIERKEINDFTQSIKNLRIWKQLEEIKQYPKYLLIIEGDIYSQKILHPNSLRGAILSIATSYKIPIIFTKHPKETAQYISILANKKTKEHTTNPNKKALNKEQQKQFILESFPGIGPVKAKGLLEKLFSLKEIFNSSKEELEPILGKKTESFIEMLIK